MDVASSSIPNVDAREAAHFGAMARDWWDPRGSSAMLHRLNPVRLAFIRRAIDTVWDGDPATFTPLKGRRALDVGCGAGLLAEPLARLGAAVTALDAAPENIAAAQGHAARQGLTIDYRAGGVEAVAGERYDLVTCLEVIEHVPDQPAFLTAVCAAVAKGGVLVLSTPNRTAFSRAALVGVAESVGIIPRGTHDWDRFITPEEMTTLLTARGFAAVELSGVAVSPATGFALSDSTALNYILAATRR